jgi:hypothetical protein
VFINKILCFIFLLTVFSCEKKSLSEKEKFIENLKEYLNVKHQIKLNNSIKKVFILTDENCHSCNKFFAKTIEKNINDSSSLLLVSASSSKIDLSPFDGANNVFFENKSKEIFLFDNSKIIFLNQEKIDTIISIKLDNLDSFQREIAKRN